MAMENEFQQAGFNFLLTNKVVVMINNSMSAYYLQTTVLTAVIYHDT